jgi:hypothetical protein
VINECRAKALRRVVRERRATGEIPAVGATARPLAEDGEAMQRVVNQIDPVLREPFLLLYVEELPYVRIASLTGAPVQTLERQVDRACARLREIVPPAARDTQLSSVGMELLSGGEPAPSLAVQVATPLRRPEVLNDSFDDRLMTKLLRARATPDANAGSDAATTSSGSSIAAITPGAAAPLPPSPWTAYNEPHHGPSSRRMYLAIAGVAGCLALASFITGYAARRWRDVRDVERRSRPQKPTVVTKIVRRTDTVRVVRSDTVVLARFDFVDDAAHSVSLVGDFNDWSASATPLQQSGSKGAWTTTLALAPGRYEYAFLVDGKRWALDRFSGSVHEEAGVQSSAASFGSAEPAAAGDASAARTRIKKLLPRDAADGVLAKISAAKEQGLPAGALEQSALKLAAKRVTPRELERAIGADADRLARSRRLLAATRRSSTSPGEVIAGAELLRQGGDSATVMAVAHAAPANRSLTAPLEVVAQLVAGGMSAEEAVDKVRTRLHNDAPDAALERWADETVARLASAAKTKNAKVAKRGGSTDIHQAGSPKSADKKKKAAAPTHKP